MLGPNDLPFAVVGDRCFIKADPPRKFSDGGLEIPTTSQFKPFTGTLLDAGLSARDKLRDAGIRIGDRVLYGKFAGVLEEWVHIVEGDASLPESEYDFAFYKAEAGSPRLYKCTKTGAIKAVEPVVVLNADDILASEHLADRIRAGETAVNAGQHPDGSGRTYHYVSERSVTANGHA